MTRYPSLRSQALDQIRRNIIIGSLPPGSLHSEQTIAEELQISRTPVREALLQLVTEGLIEFLPQRGVKIADIDPVQLEQMLEFRASLESFCAAALAENTNKKVLDGLKAVLERQRKIIAKDDRVAWVQANMDFHLQLVSSQGNRLMREAMVALAGHTMRIGYRMNERKERMRESLKEHSAIVAAISRGEEDRARALTKEHLYVTEVLLRQFFEDRIYQIEKADL